MSVSAAQPRLVRAATTVIAVLVLVVGAWSTALAQGVTTGAVRGTVTDQQGQPIVGAAVQMVNTASGQRYGATATEGGRFFVANVVPGNYTVEARAIGYRPLRKAQDVGLGRVEEVTLALEASTVELTPLEASVTVDNTLASPNRTGAAVSVDRNLIANLPSINHNFADFAATNSLVNTTGGGTGVSIAGISDRFNSLQIDGGVNNDLFGLAASNGSPGGANNSRPISIEAVQEYQVLIAPYDVRQGGFTGGLINAVTRSGTNDFHGSTFFSLQNQDLTGMDTLGRMAGYFTTSFYGGSFGGPIIKDRVHFFVSGEWRHNVTPFSGLSVGTLGPDTLHPADSAGIGIGFHTVTAIRNFSTTSLGFDPGSSDGPVFPQPDQNVFAKLSFQLGSRSQAEISYNGVNSSRLSLFHTQGSASATNIRDGYNLAASGYHVNSKTNSFRGRLNTPFGERFTNEMIASYNYFADNRTPDTHAPMILIGGDRRDLTKSCEPYGHDSTLTGKYVPPTTAGCPSVFVGIGGERFSHLNILNQKTTEIQDNLTADYGSHVFTLGGRYSRFHFYNAFFPESNGAWLFPDTAAFLAGTPTRYEINLPGSFADTLNGRKDGPIADFVFNEFSLYAQDQYQPVSHLSLTIGLRADFDALPSPKYNPLLDTLHLVNGPNAGDQFGIRTDTKATSAALLSPRFGFNYDISGDATTVLRGGIGLFAGRTPYVWASNAYTGTGLEQVTLTCTPGTGANVPGQPGVRDSLNHVPGFTADPNAQPTSCANPLAGLTLPKPSVVYFDKNFKLPQNLRVSLGFDRRLPGGWIGSFDGLYTHAVNQFSLTDDNLVQGGFSTGEANRVLYGTQGAGGVTPVRQTTLANQVLHQYNTNKDYSYSLTFNLSRKFGSGSEITASYTYSRSYDLMSYSSDISSSLLANSTLDGTLLDRNLRPSWFDIPHSIRVVGTTTLPYDVRLSLEYQGHSGRPYAWDVNGDANGDGNSNNDLVYVPLNSSDITLSNPAQWTTLDNFIQSQKCLREARGSILHRGACRNPWNYFLDMRLARSFPTMRGQNLELTANLYNVLSFLGVGGQVYQVSSFENIAMLRLSGYDVNRSRGIYTLSLPNVGNNPNAVNVLSTFASRWKLELGARYAF